MHELLSQHFGRRRNVVRKIFRNEISLIPFGKSKKCDICSFSFLHVRDLAVDCIHWFNAPSRFCRSMFRFVFENKTAAICNGALVLGSNYSFFFSVIEQMLPASVMCDVILFFLFRENIRNTEVMPYAICKYSAYV